MLAGGVEEPRARGGKYEAVFDILFALSADWDAVIEVPLGTTLGIEYRQTPEVAGLDDGPTKNIYLRIGYTGEDEFGLGLQAQYMFVPIGGVTDEVNFIAGLVDFKFYF